MLNERKSNIVGPRWDHHIDKVYLNDPAKIEYLPNAIEGLQLFRDLGYKLIVVTNQSGIARGLVTLDNLKLIHDIIRENLSQNGIDIAAFYFAPFSVESNHHMRKPNPGMLEAAARDFNLDLTSCLMIGDRETDVAAGITAGCQTVLLGPSTSESKAHYICDDLKQAAFWWRSQLET